MAEWGALEEARTLLADQTPLKADCGRICGAACCQSEGAGDNGMLLYPGEEAYYREAPWARLIPEERTGGFRLVCRGWCPRENRPLACRIFPLITLPGGRVRRDIRAWPVCPLMPAGLRGLDGDFVAAVRQAARRLSEAPAQAAFLETLEAITNEYRELSRLMNPPRRNGDV